MGIIQCGSFTGNITNTLGWEPQFVMLKRTDSTGDWMMIDSMRGCSVGGIDMILNPNTSAAEITTNDYIDFTATGFISKNLTGSYIYMAIRRQNKPPTSGTQVYNAIARTGTGAAATVTGVGFAPDLMISQPRNASAANWYDRLRGPNRPIYSSGTGAETPQTDTVMSFNMDGVTLGADSMNWGVNQPIPIINHFFKRAPDIFDVVCYTGTGSARTVNHSLGVAPELVIVKKRSATSDWRTLFVSTPTLLRVNGTNGGIFDDGSLGTYFGNGTTYVGMAPTATVFRVGIAFDVNQSANTYIAYLFATKTGISKVSSYTGNGTSQTINCGFSTGARFCLIKRTDSTGDWCVWDSTRGIISANDPHLSLNTAAAEVTTDDSIDPDSTGFIVNQVAATNINVSSASYIYLAFA